MTSSFVHRADATRGDRDNPAGAASPDRADRARGRAAPPHPRLAVAVARRGADRPARAREPRRPAAPGRDARRRTRRCSTCFEWVWTRVAGTSEVALRLPSALFGIALVPVAFAIGRRLGGQRAAVALAALVAVQPAARLLLAGGARLRGGRARVRGRVRLLPRCARGKASAVVGARLGRRARLPLLRDLPGRDRGGDPARAPRPRRLPALGGVALAGAALLPLLAEQVGGDHTAT